MSWTYSAKNGSVERGTCFWQGGWRPKAFQGRWTVDLASPVTSAIQRNRFLHLPTV